MSAISITREVEGIMADREVTYSIFCEGKLFGTKKIPFTVMGTIEFDGLKKLFDEFPNRSMAHNFMLLKGKIGELKDEDVSSLYFIINKENWPEPIEEEDKDAELIWSFENILILAIFNIKEM